MHRMLLALWLLGAAIYAGFSFVPAPDQPLVETAKHADRAASQSPKPTAPQRPAVAERTVPTAAPADAAREVETGTPDEKPQTAASDQTPSSTGLTNDPPGPEEFQHDYHDYGEVSPSAPVHSGPSVDSEIVGYATTGAPVQVVERRAGWMKVIDPSTQKEGWIYEIYVTPTERRNGLDAERKFEPLEEAGVGPPDDAAISQPQRPKPSIKSKKGKKFGSKRKRLRFVLRLRRR